MALNVKFGLALKPSLRLLLSITSAWILFGGEILLVRLCVSEASQRRTGNRAQRKITLEDSRARLDRFDNIFYHRSRFILKFIALSMDHDQKLSTKVAV